MVEQHNVNSTAMSTWEKVLVGLKLTPASHSHIAGVGLVQKG